MKEFFFIVLMFYDAVKIIFTMKAIILKPGYKKFPHWHSDLKILNLKSIKNLFYIFLKFLQTTF